MPVMASEPKDRLKKIAEEFNQYQPQKKRAKHNRTISLDVENYLTLQEYCKRKGMPANVVIDRLIADFLDALNEAGELPPSLKDPE
jgi:hypothetical protein